MKPIAIHVKRKKEYDVLMAHFQAKGMKWSDGKSPAEGNHFVHYGDETCISIGNNGMGYSPINYYSTEGYEVVKFSTYAAIVGIDYSYDELVLSDGYTAKIDHESRTIKVGCQSFTFDKMEELYNKIKP